MLSILEKKISAIIYAIEGSQKKDLSIFLQKLAKKAINLKAVVMDMSVPDFPEISKMLLKIDIFLMTFCFFCY